jgi:ABC-type glycerol-3-phosphate transport system substrate-binding protein
MFDDESLIEPMITAYEDSHLGVKIHYKQFVDLEDYIDLVLREFADGEGPDIFSMPNTWFAFNYHLLNPMPSEFGDTSLYKNIFIDQVYKDMVYKDDFNAEHIYGLPLYVDNLALYYNKEHFDKAGISGPPDTWLGVKEDAVALSALGYTPIALGRTDNISRSVDILYLLFLQHGINFYSSNYISLGFVDDFYESVMFFLGFSYPDYDYDLNEIDAFARGELSMFIDYSYANELLLERLNLLESWGVASIAPDSFAVSRVPQLYSPDSSILPLLSYSNYFSEAVSINSEHPDIAWDFLFSLASEENLDYYYSQTHRPSSRIDMLDVQKNDPLYGVFAEQAVFASSFPLFDSFFLFDYFTSLIASFKLDSSYDAKVVEIQDLFDKHFLNEAYFASWIE